MRKADIPAIAPEMRTELIGIVKDELSSIPGLRFNHKDAEHITYSLIAIRVAGRTLESALPQAFRTTDIANKITELADAWRPYGADTQKTFYMMLGHPFSLTLTTKNLTDKVETLLRAWQPTGITGRAIYDLFQTQPQLFNYNVNTIQDKVKIISGLLLTGDLPTPLDTGQPRDFSKALRIIMGSTTYGDLIRRSIEEIHAIALLTRLQKVSVGEACKKNNNSERSNKIRKHLAAITDKEWDLVKHLAEKAGFVRPVRLSPDRRELMRAAAARIEAKKAQP